MVRLYNLNFTTYKLSLLANFFSNSPYFLKPCAAITWGRDLQVSHFLRSNFFALYIAGRLYYRDFYCVYYCSSHCGLYYSLYCVYYCISHYGLYSVYYMYCGGSTIHTCLQSFYCGLYCVYYMYCV